MVIEENKYYDSLRGMQIVEIRVGEFSTRIANWEDNKLFQLSFATTPKCLLIDIKKNYKSVKNAKKDYLKSLKIYLEDVLEELKDIDYRSEELKKKHLDDNPEGAK